MHLLAYNLIRGIMAEAARVEEIKPRTISFAGSLHTVRAFEASHLYDPVRIEASRPATTRISIKASQPAIHNAALGLEGVRFIAANSQGMPRAATGW